MIGHSLGRMETCVGCDPPAPIGAGIPIATDTSNSDFGDMLETIGAQATT